MFPSTLSISFNLPASGTLALNMCFDHGPIFGLDLGKDGGEYLPDRDPNPETDAHDEKVIVVLHGHPCKRHFTLVVVVGTYVYLTLVRIDP